MKQFLCLFTFLSLLLSFISCGDKEEGLPELHTSYWKDANWNGALIYSEDLSSCEGEMIVEKFVDFPAFVTMPPKDSEYCDVIYADNYREKILYDDENWVSYDPYAIPVKQEYKEDVRVHRFSVRIADLKKFGVEYCSDVYITADLTNIARFKAEMEGMWPPVAEDKKDIIPEVNWSEELAAIYFSGTTGKLFDYDVWRLMPTQRKALLKNIAIKR